MAAAKRRERVEFFPRMSACDSYDCFSSRLAPLAAASAYVRVACSSLRAPSS